MPTATGAEGRGVVLLDTSAAVAFVVEGHEAHEATLEALRGRSLGLAGHAWFETYSVLTRLPSDLRLSPKDALRVLERNFPVSVFLGERETAALREELALLGISGGSVYDALVGAAARRHGRPLASRDNRARSAYDSLSVEVVPIS